VGIFTLSLKDSLLEKIIFGLIGFSAGALIGSAFLHILPEVLERVKSGAVFYYVILGILAFFLLERYFHWRHCHEDACALHAFTYLNLIGDSLHNFIDGMVIAASFVVSIRLGVATTLAIILHEIPQELSDFGVLVYGGFGKVKALCYNFISALTAMLGAVTGYFILGANAHLSNFLLPFTAGGFIYIATCDLIPEIHKEKNFRRSTWAFVAFLLGIAFMVLVKQLLP
jgi:zinc and cadmium transporter